MPQGLPAARTAQGVGGQGEERGTGPSTEVTWRQREGGGGLPEERCT